MGGHGLPSPMMMNLQQAQQQQGHLAAGGMGGMNMGRHGATGMMMMAPEGGRYAAAQAQGQPQMMYHRSPLVAPSYTGFYASAFCPPPPTPSHYYPHQYASSSERVAAAAAPATMAPISSATRTPTAALSCNVKRTDPDAQREGERP
ncbi:unnamed protein product [Spirodela intermedia]|uniref:Uncharacterized protein n=1 Tax=Spirodela intermedia TaxID=51605 RepID=A0A7I8J581_SPIIN|nr:unnamed protein product [Spirodela intermedia]CAA6665387.1 unnamed protein product [Spirodela intermedia]